MRAGKGRGKGMGGKCFMNYRFSFKNILKCKRTDKASREVWYVGGRETERLGDKGDRAELWGDCCSC